MISLNEILFFIINQINYETTLNVICLRILFSIETPDLNMSKIIILEINLDKLNKNIRCSCN